MKKRVVVDVSLNTDSQKQLPHRVQSVHACRVCGLFLRRKKICNPT